MKRLFGFVLIASFLLLQFPSGVTAAGDCDSVEEGSVCSEGNECRLDDDQIGICHYDGNDCVCIPAE